MTEFSRTGIYKAHV